MKHKGEFYLYSEMTLSKRFWIYLYITEPAKKSFHLDFFFFVSQRFYVTLEHNKHPPME